MSPPRPALLARSGTLDAIDDAQARLVNLRATLESELKAQGDRIDMLTAALAEERNARDGWKSRAEIAEAALDAARKDPDPRPALRAIEEAKAKEGGPVCRTCSDTHTMSLEDRDVPCTRCPVPCPMCRLGGTGAYCAHTPCQCKCHEPRVVP